MATNTRSTPRRSARTGEFISRARQEATTPRLVAAGAVAAGAGAYALLRDPARRDWIKETAMNYVDKASAWWNEARGKPEPTASDIQIS